MFFSSPLEEGNAPTAVDFFPFLFPLLPAALENESLSVFPPLPLVEKGTPFSLARPSLASLFAYISFPPLSGPHHLSSSSFPFSQISSRDQFSPHDAGHVIPPLEAGATLMPNTPLPFFFSPAASSHSNTSLCQSSSFFFPPFPS